MFKKVVTLVFVALIIFLLNLTVAFPAEPLEQNRVIQILSIAKKVKATDTQVAVAIASGITPEEFLTQTMGRIRLVAPDKVPKGSPVQIVVEGMPKKAAELWRRHPEMPTDVWLELYDRNGKPVNIFWSSDQGPRIFELIVAENGPEVPILEIASHQMLYGLGPGPTPIPFPEPPSPSSELQSAVEPLVQFAAREVVGAQDLLNLTEFYFDFADIVRRDNANVIKTTATFRNTYINAGGLMFQQTGMKGKYAGMAEIVDGIISDSIGLDIVPLDAQKTANVLNAVAWAYYQPLKEE